MDVQRPSEIKARHLARRAIVYERVSTPQQAESNKGSLAYQKAQGRYAEMWGWPASAIEHIDEDLGRSGTSADGRTGYQRLTEDIRRGRVGIVLTSDVSRVGREFIESCMLINDCAATDTLLAMDGRVYDVRESGHLLVVRLVAMLSEHDNVTRAAHSRQGRLGKLAQGISVSMAPTGYLRDKETGRFNFHPSQAVQAAIHQVFSTFLAVRNVRKTVAALRAKGIELPRMEKGAITWHPATRTRVQAFVENETYAGAYLFGRTKFERGANGKGRSRPAAAEDVTRIPNHHDGYVTSEAWAEIQHILRTNGYARDHTKMGNGPALLQGLVRCAAHGFRALTSLYPRGRCATKARMTYRCTGNADAEEKCKTVSGQKLDELVLREVFKRLAPAGLDALRAALASKLEDLTSAPRRLKRQLEAARRRSENLKNLVVTIDPDHRLARDRLEQEFERALDTEKRLAFALRQEEEKLPVGLECIDELERFSSSIPTIFWADVTSNADRKALLRTVIRAVVIDGWSPEAVRARIVWKIDPAETPVEIKKLEYFRSKMRNLATGGLTPEQIALEMNTHELANKFGRPWRREAVARAIAGGWVGRTREMLERQRRYREMHRRAYAIILEMKARGERYRRIADELNRIGLKTRTGRRWVPTAVSQVARWARLRAAGAMALSQGREEERSLVVQPSRDFVAS
jgi:DNA invertase Pin-like site-specific DNA recombinase